MQQRHYAQVTEEHTEAQKGWKTRLTLTQPAYHDLDYQGSCQCKLRSSAQISSSPTHPPARTGACKSWRPFTPGAGRRGKREHGALMSFPVRPRAGANRRYFCSQWGAPSGPQVWRQPLAVPRKIQFPHFFQHGLPGEILIAVEQHDALKKEISGSGKWASRKAVQAWELTPSHR